MSALVFENTYAGIALMFKDDRSLLHYLCTQCTGNSYANDADVYEADQHIQNSQSRGQFSQIGIPRSVSGVAV